MIERFELNPDQLRIREILTDKSFLEVEIYAISNANPNRNMSHFTLDSMKKGLATFADKPILGFFNQNDFESHNGRMMHDPEFNKDYWDNSNGEQILGFVRQSDHKEIVEGPDGLMWIRCTAMICTQYNYKQVKRLLKDKRKKVSVEVDYKESEVIDGILNIYDFELVGITILGSKNGVQVKEGIEGAHMSVLDIIESDVFSRQKKALVFAYSQLDPTEKEKNKEDTDLADNFENYTLNVNKSKEALSDKSWSDVNKTELRNKVVNASNFKEVAKDVFLDLREGWEDGETTKLKYPVMELKGDNNLVYNRGGLASAKAYAQKNGEEEVLSKLRSIYKDLDLEFDEDDAKYSFDCGEDAELLYGDEQKKASDDECDNDDESNNGEKSGEVDNQPSSDDSQKKEEYNFEELTKLNNELRAKCDELKSKNDEYEGQFSQLNEKCENYEKQCSELNCKYSDLQKECDKYMEECKKLTAKVEEYALKVADYEQVKCALDKANKKFAAMKIDEQIKYVEQMKSKYNLMSTDIADMLQKCNRGEYADNTCIDKDFAYVIFQKQQSGFGSYSYNVDIIRPNNTNSESRKNKNVFDRLKDNVNQN